MQEIERWLFQGKVVVLAGFGGMGKTALAREAADWLTRTGLYSRACFISFEQGGDASTLLSTLGQFLAVYDSHFHPQDHAAALARLAPVLKQSPTLVIADNVESLLPGGEAPLLLEERLALWETLRELTIQKAGVLLTCRDPGVGDGLLAEGKDVAHLSLGGMKSEDAYLLASRLLDKLKIDHASVPYADLCDLLGKLDYHPLAIQLVVSTLRKLSLTQIREDFATLLPQFIDEQDTGRNRSLLASLEYSLKRLEAEQQALLPRLALFEGGANENNLLTITDIPRPQWASLCRSLEQAGLLTAEHIHNAIDIPFLRFHPVLGIFLRSQPGADNLYLRYRYAISYYMLSNYLYEEDIRHPQEMRAICLRELSNLRRALDLLLELREWEAAVGLFDKIVKFLNIFGRLRERDTLRQHMTEMLKTTNAQPSETLSRVEYIHQSGLGEDDLNRGNIQAAIARFSALLEQIESLPETVQEGQGSFVHCRILTMLAVCLKDTHQFATSELRLRQALEIIDTLLKQTPEYQIFIFHQNTLLGELAETLREQGRYSEARKIYEESLQISRKQGYLRQQAINMQGFGTLALREKALDEAQVYYTEACALFHAVGELREEASCWHQLGMVAEWQGNWGKAEVCYRESLMLREHFDNADELAATYNQLAIVARRAGRPSEAEGWYKSALELDERLHPGSYRHATHLSNLAGLLMLEMRAGHTSLERLAEAHGYAEQALAIMELHDTSEIWEVLYILAGIAEMEGQTELAHAYRHREREAYAAFAGNRSNIDRQHEQLIASVVEAARGSIRMREAVEIVLPQLEAAHRDISNAIQRLWTGEREWHSLAEGTSAKTALLILRILETLAQPTKQAEIEGSSLESLAVLASLAARGHLQTRAALEQAFPQLEANGKHIVAAIRRIWTGERDLPTLTNGFNIQETLVVGRILDLLAKPSRLAEDKENNADEADFLRPTSAPEAPME
ncbi:MAG TPA: tetratricopeptide repeat protein [Ktedonobacterales bacterium]|nr:tetratricopeptide repeat protein [Ktedonobacterales bacterium]